MPLLNVCVASSVRTLLPWTVVQVDDELTFTALYQKIVAGVYPMLTVCTTGYQLTKVMVGSTKDSLSAVDPELMVDDVLEIFGHCAKFVVKEDGISPQG